MTACQDTELGVQGGQSQREGVQGQYYMVKRTHQQLLRSVHLSIATLVFFFFFQSDKMKVHLIITGASIKSTQLIF